MRFLAITLFLSILQPVYALEKLNLKLYNYAKACPENSAKNLNSLVDYLYKGGNNQTQRVELFCYWIAENIAYDTEAYESGKKTDTDKILSYKKGVCQNYAELLQKMCNAVRIECHLISGYSKGYSYFKNKPFPDTDHSWNIVKVDGKYLFIDATWSSGYVEKVRGSLTFFKKLKIKEIFADPNYFLTTHLPGDPRWQLRDNPITLKSFSNNDSIKEMLKFTIPKYTYLDSLKTYLVADSIDQKIISLRSTYNFNPVSSHLKSLADTYFNKAWKISHDAKEAKDYESAIDWYNQTINLYSKLNNSHGVKWIGNAKKNINYCNSKIKALKEIQRTN